MKLSNLASIVVVGALLAPAAQAQHKTGFEFNFELGLVNKEEDKKVEGDKSALAFKTRRARWWLSGKFAENFDYKFRFKFKKGSVDLSYVKVGYKLSDDTKVTFGRDFDPLPIASVVDDSYSLSTSPFTNGAVDSFEKGVEGVQLTTDVGVGELAFGIANGAKLDVPGYGETSLSAFGFGASYAGDFGMFSPYVAATFQNTPDEKIKATGLKFKGRNDVQLSVGAGLDFGATDILINFARSEIGEAKIQNAAGVETVASKKKEIQGYEIRAMQDFTSALTGSLHYSFDTFKTDGKKTEDLQQIAAQLFMYPYAKKKAFFVFTLANQLEKPEGKKDFTTNKASIAFAAKPSFAIAKK